MERHALFETELDFAESLLIRIFKVLSKLSREMLSSRESCTCTNLRTSSIQASFFADAITRVSNSSCSITLRASSVTFSVLLSVLYFPYYCNL